MRAEVARRVDPSDGGDANDAVVMWAARVMDRIVTERGSDESVADVDDAWARHGGGAQPWLARAQRVLRAVCAADAR